MKHIIMTTFMLMQMIHSFASIQHVNQLGIPVTVIHQVDGQNQDYQLVQFKHHKKGLIKRILHEIQRIKHRVKHKLAQQGQIGNFVFSILIGLNVIASILLVVFGINQSSKNNADELLNSLFYGFFLLLSLLLLLILLIAWAFYNIMNVATSPELRKIEKPKRKKKSKKSKNNSTTQKKRKILL